MNSKICFSFLGISLVTMLCFQNCSVRRLEGINVASNGVNTGPGGTGGAGGSSTACLIQPDTEGAVQGVVQEAAIKSSYSMIVRQAAMGEFVPASTSLLVSATSICTSRADTTKVVRCDATPPPCQPSKLSMLNVILKCDNANDKATACANFEGKLNQEIDLTDATLGNYITIMATNASNVCDTNTISTYMPSLFGTPKVGKIKILKLETLATGKIATVQLIGVELLKNGTDAANKMTVDGKFSGEVIEFAACQR